MTDYTKVADEREAFLQNEKMGENNAVPRNQEENKSSKNIDLSDSDKLKTIDYIWDYFDHSKFQFLLFFNNLFFFFLFKNNIDNDNNFPEGKENCFSLRSWSILVECAYFAGIFIRLTFLTLMAIVVYYKKKIRELGTNANKPEHKELVTKKVWWNLSYKYFYEKRDLFLGVVIVIGIFLLVGMTIATTQSEPCGNLRNLALFWIYIYNIVFLFFPISMLIMCLYPYNIACKIFSGFLRFYSLQLDIFEIPKKKRD